ncbi:hypothetical protein P3T43_001783 [Paraburkholderia sp. GAS41]|uniref:hypothetical protein n=1 Tax=Paraburkholderia sp. GAS41 TaxID=3035134 RepID=UPI003D1CFC22
MVRSRITEWCGEDGKLLTVKLYRALPAIIAATRMRRKRDTLEINVHGRDVRTVAQSQGFNRIPKNVLSRAMIAAGATPWEFTGGSRQYIFRGAMHAAEVVAMVSKNIDQHFTQESE